MLNKLDACVGHVVLAVLVFLIVYWLFNDSKFRVTLEGLANDPNAKPKPKPKGGDTVKCPEDCTSVKELQIKLSDAMKKVQTLEASIIENTNTGIAHSKSIADMNQSINDMQSNQKDE
jgi:hypothetical protein